MRYRHIWTVLATLILSLASITPNVGQQWSEQQRAWTRISSMLAERVSFHCRQMPLADAVRALRRQSGINIVLDQPALVDNGISSSEPVSIDLNDVTMASLLDALLAPLELAWTVSFESILITTPDRDESELLHVRVYVVSDLVQIASTDGVEEDYDALIDALISTVASETWAENGGGEADIRPLASSNALVISQTFRVHRQIEQLLAELRDARRSQGLSVLGVTSTIANDVRSKSRRQRVLRYQTYVNLDARWRKPRVYTE
jgi:hypothetical protein